MVSEPEQSRDMRVVAIASQKGGVAKTTTAINWAAELAASGKRVLIIDLDPQGHLAEGLGISAWDLKSDISEVLLREKSLQDIIINIDTNLDLAPANIRLAHIENTLFSVHRREDRLKSALEPLRGLYDVCLIDCPPSLGILTINAFSAAREVLIPMSAEFYSLLGVDLLLQTIDGVRSEINPDLQVIGILPTRVTRTNHAAAVIEKAKENWPDIPVLDSPVPDLVIVRESVAAGKPLREFAPDSPATAAYHSLAKEV